MCGIGGLWNEHGLARGSARAVALLDALAHRGPDGEGVLAIPPGRLATGLRRGTREILDRPSSVGFLLHRRLSIVDVGGGAQPMSNEDGLVWVILNGEIYNQLDLRAVLSARGHRFATKSDTEVLVHGWEEWGVDLFPRLNGMYACGVFDGRGDGEVWLARDPVGVKPLYLGKLGETWWFASELAAARRAGLLQGDLRGEAFAEFLVYRFVPSPGTFYRDVWKIPPGHYCELREAGRVGRPVLKSFTPAFVPAVLPRGRQEWREAVRAGLVAAVRRQLMSDVPLGALLSGGVDSTVVTQIMRESMSEPPTGFAIGFTDAPEIDELDAARHAASALKVPLTEVQTIETAYLEAWPRQIAAVGEPIANSSTLLVDLLCQTVRRTRKVVLCGQGADEPFGGYPRHSAERFYKLARLASPLWNVLPERTLASDRVSRIRRVVAQGDETRRFAEILAVFGVKEVEAFSRAAVDPQSLTEPVHRWLMDAPVDDSLNRLLLVDARLSLADDLLIVADHMSMASSVELRVPFLDLEFLALIERMPSRYKISRLGSRKWLYREAVRDLLPESLRRPLTGVRARVGRKLGFSTPLDRWFTRWCVEEAEPFILGPQACLPDFLRPEALQSLLSGVRNQALPRGRQLLSLYVLEVWLRGAMGSQSSERTHAR